MVLQVALYDPLRNACTQVNHPNLDMKDQRLEAFCFIIIINAATITQLIS